MINAVLIAKKFVSRELPSPWFPYLINSQVSEIHLVPDTHQLPHSYLNKIQCLFFKQALMIKYVSTKRNNFSLCWNFSCKYIITCILPTWLHTESSLALYVKLLFLFINLFKNSIQIQFVCVYNPSVTHLEFKNCLCIPIWCHWARLRKAF